MSISSYITIRKYNDPIMAELVANSLRDADIQVIVSGTHDMYIAVREIHMTIHVDDVDRALEIITQLEDR
jgi:hypothetical protein